MRPDNALALFAMMLLPLVVVGLGFALLARMG
jgi:hypothetical protein